jgi:Zn-dependent M28 family amino/carboxypeptidase
MYKNYKNSFLLVGLLLLSAVACNRSESEIDSNTAKLLESISADDIRAHIAYLADDKLQGRYTGSEGYQLAVDYVVNLLAENNIEPAGDSGSYFQNVPIRKTWISESSIVLSSKKGNESLVLNKDYVVYPNPDTKDVKLDADLAFVGYGISAPELNYDDYAGLDVRGKIVVALSGSPKNLPINAREQRTKIRSVAATHGAAGLILVSATANLRPARSSTTLILPESQHEPAVSELKLFATIPPARLYQLFQADGLDTTLVFAKIREGNADSKPLHAKLKVAYSSEHSDFESVNVLGKITGSDTLRKNEYVVHSAHLDHLGIGAPVDGDSIYNGAHDNASGVAFTLEIAKVYAQLKTKNKRSIIFIFLAGEEIGMLGSAYFAAYPTVEKQNIVADINIDMPTIIAPLLSVSAIGSEHTTLIGSVLKAGAYLHVDVEPDPEPEQNRFVRSDQFSFVKEGIPAIRINNGNKTADGANNLKEKAQEWRAKNYHKPSDDINGPFDFEAARLYTQFNFLLGYFVAQDEVRPSWNDDSIYKKE